jgi:glycosyltransferase involved in cell wall biosynthesis
MMPRRVAYVLNVFPKVSETFIANELAELRRREIDVLILSRRLPADEPRHEIVARAGLLERTVYEPRDFAAAVRAFRPELVHAHFATSATEVARELAREHRLPFTFTAHRYDIYARPPLDFGARAAAARAVVTVSEANARYISRSFGVPRGHIRVIPCGVDTELFRPNGRRAAPPHVVCVARLVPFKNQSLLLEACALLQQRGRELRCVLVGDGPSRDDLEAVRGRLGLEKTVELVGAADQAQVRAWWQQATAAVLCSDNEGLPVSLMEAGACGVPAVATAVAGLPELVEDGRTGFLTPAGDASALASVLERLLRDPALVERLGSTARGRIVERFSLRQQVDGLLALWSDIVSRETRAWASP